MRRYVAFALLLLGIGLLAACGQKGALYLPQPATATAVPSPAASAAKPAGSTTAATPASDSNGT
ncbi:MAG: lipoprotein [Xanthomonadaceae bacterium]|nr:lipoprotein [Xanthomonadaceae bacterium]